MNTRLSSFVSHGFHLVDLSMTPLVASICAGNTMVSIIMCFNNKFLSTELFFINLTLLLVTVCWWCQEIVNEGSFRGLHTKIVQKNLLDGFNLLVLSEVLIFVTLFYSYFYVSLTPSVEFGGYWPPKGIEVIDYLGWPIFNTALLFVSSLTITIAMKELANSRTNAILYIVITLLLCLVFTYFQYVEYMESGFTIQDSVYGASFYTLTGFHGIHVIMGTVLLLVNFIRLLNSHFTETHWVGLCCSSVYLHFLDYVWLILYVVLYIWGT